MSGTRSCTKILNYLSQCKSLPSVRVCTKCWREPHNHLRNLLKLPLPKDRRKKLKLTVVYKCLMVWWSCPQTFFPSEPFKLEPEITCFCISHLHTQIVIFIPVSQVLCPYGTNCLKTFTTLSPFLLLYPLSITFFRVNFALAHAICSSCAYISNIYYKSV